MSISIGLLTPVVCSYQVISYQSIIHASSELSAVLSFRTLSTDQTMLEYYEDHTSGQVSGSAS